MSPEITSKAQNLSPGTGKVSLENKFGGYLKNDNKLWQRKNQQASKEDK